MELLVLIALAVFIVFNIFVIVALSSLIKMMERGSNAIGKISDQARNTLKQINQEVDHIKSKVDVSFDSIGLTLANSNNYLNELRSITSNVNQFFEKSNESIILFNEKIVKFDEIKPTINQSTDLINHTCIVFISSLRKIDRNIDNFTFRYAPTTKLIANLYVNYYKPAKKIYSMLNLLKKGFKIFTKK
jgi:hypothetical protein